MNKGAKTMSGLSILGICIAVVGVLVVIWGASLYGLLSLDFMAFAVGGAIMLAVGLWLIAGLSPIIQIGGIWLAAIATMAYLFMLPDTDLMIRLIGFVPIIGLAVWLTTKLLK